MKSYRFKLFLTLLLCLTVLGSSAAAEAVHPSVAKAYDRQLLFCQTSLGITRGMMPLSIFSNS